MARLFRLNVTLLGALLLGLITGCSPYVRDYQYLPRPALAEIPATQPSQPPPVSALVSVIGIRRDDQKQQIPESVEVRLRIENNGQASVIFNPQSLQLTDGSLVRFPPPLLRPPQTWSLPPMQAAEVTAYFPFPPGRTWDEMDLQTVQLRWTVAIDAHPVGQTVFFRRVIYYYYHDPYWDDPRFGFYGGVIIAHHHRR